MSDLQHIAKIQEAIERLREIQVSPAETECREELAAVLQELVAVQIDLLRRAQNGTGARKAESVLTPDRPSAQTVSESWGDVSAGSTGTPLSHVKVSRPGPSPVPFPGKVVGVPGKRGGGVAGPSVQSNFVVSEKAARRKRLRASFGGSGFLLSLGLHGILALIAVFWVITTYVVKSPDSADGPTVFATGAGGGTQGDRAKIYEHRIRPRNARNLVSAPGKITVKGPAALGLPEVPHFEMTPMLLQGALAGGSSKGFGGGSGGGIGKGQGLGVGDGRNLVGKFKVKEVMGVKMSAGKIAVYLDNSGSMTPYLPQVKEKIYAEYPDADIFEIMGCSVIVRGGLILGGRDWTQRHTAPSSGGYHGRVTAEKLSEEGTRILDRSAESFRLGGLGAWLDIMVFENYDALVVFADFQDTVQSGRWSTELPKKMGKEGPKLYLFSIQHPPDGALEKCVRASAGETKLVMDLRVLEKRPRRGR